MKDLCLSPAKNCPRRLAARWNRTERLPGWPRPFTVCSPLFASLTLSPSAPPPAPRLRPSRPSSLSLRGARHLRACCSLFPAAPASPSVPHPAAHLLTFPQGATAHPGGCHPLIDFPAPMGAFKERCSCSFICLLTYSLPPPAERMDPVCLVLHCIQSPAQGLAHSRCSISYLLTK